MQSVFTYYISCDLLCDVQVIQSGVGCLIVARRPQEQQSNVHDASKYLPCEFCYGFYRRDCLAAHAKQCIVRPKDSPAPNYIRNGTVMLAPFMNTDSDEMASFFDKMKETVENPGLRELCRKDKLIYDFAKAQLERIRDKSEQRLKAESNVSTKVRTVGRLLVRLNKDDNTSNELSFYITGKQFQNVVDGVKKLLSTKNNRKYIYI